MTYRFSAPITKEDGKDVESARANLGEAIELFIETWGWPEERPAEGPAFWTTVELSHGYAEAAECLRRARHSRPETRWLRCAMTKR